MIFFKLIIFGSFILVITACSSRSGKDGQDTDVVSEKGGQDILTGSMDVVVDETVAALLHEQVEVFHSDYIKSRINLVSEPERVAINTLLNGTAGVAVLTRELTEEENAGFKQRSIKPKVFPVAYDGIVLVVRKSDSDTLIRVEDIKLYLQGQAKTNKKLVFDNVNSSTLRFLKELVGIERVMATQVQTMQHVSEVFTAVLEEEGRIGVMSLNQFLANKDALDTFDNIRILAVKSGKDGLSYKPSQSSLADDTYPLKQEIYVLNYQPNLGLGIGFSAFLTGDRGQRIVLRAGILPAKVPGRELIIRDEFKH